MGGSQYALVFHISEMKNSNLALARRAEYRKRSQLWEDKLTIMQLLDASSMVIAANDQSIPWIIWKYNYLKKGNAKIEETKTLSFA